MRKTQKDIVIESWIDKLEKDLGFKMEEIVKYQFIEYIESKIK